MKWYSGKWSVAPIVVLATLSFAQPVIAQVNAPGARYASTKDDAEFMQGMIMHHAQAIVMAKEAPSHRASQSVQIFCARIALAQRTEINLMQGWLRDRKFAVPDTNGDMPGGMAGMQGMAGSGKMMMPGMLTPEQMKMLDQARGASWDRLFLTFMIQHHNGAIAMVDKLFKSPGAGQDDDIFKFATAVNADQTSEIDRMKSMLAAARDAGGQ